MIYHVDVSVCVETIDNEYHNAELRTCYISLVSVMKVNLKEIEHVT